MSRKVPFEIGEYYHVYNRGVDKRKIFLDEDDYSYFVHILKVFNDHAPAENVRYFYRGSTSIEKRQKPLIEIISFCLMPNHFHLLVKQVADKGIMRFLQKIGNYTHFFNKKYNRSGVLFQGKNKSRHIDKNEYLNYLKMYIELNPLDICSPGWKEGKTLNKKKSEKFLKEYKWKSAPNDEHFSIEPYVTSEEFLEYVRSIEV